MATEEKHNFNIDNEDTEGVKDFAYFGSIINSEIAAKNLRKG